MHDFTSPDNKHSALIIIDVQRDFALSGSNAEIPGTMQAIHYIQILAQGYRNLGYPIIHVVRLCGRLQQIGSMEWIMYKSRWGAFYSILLEEHLCSLDINTVIIHAYILINSRCL